MGSRGHALRYRIEYLAAAGVLKALELLPEEAAYALGGGMGRLAAALSAGRGAIARANIEMAMPELDRRAVDEILRSTYRNLGWTLVEFARMGSWVRTDLWCDRVTVSGREHLDAALKSGRAIFLAAHFGSWELMAAIMTRILPFQSAVVARPMKNPLVDRLIVGRRKHTGMEVVPHRGSFLRMLHILKEGGGIGVLLDQHTAPHEAVLCRFFGHPAGTNYGLALLAMKSGAPVIPIFLVRNGKRRHTLMFGEPMELKDPGREMRSRAVREFSQRCTNIIEGMVRGYPDQWFWVHRRWKATTHLEQFGDYEDYAREFRSS